MRSSPFGVGLVLVCAAASSALAGEIALTVEVLPEFSWQPAVAHGGVRLAFPPAAQRAPSGVVVALEGEPLKADKLEVPPTPPKLTAVAGGFEPRFSLAMLGATLDLENQEDRQIVLGGIGDAPLALAPKGKKSLPLERPGLLRVVDRDRPDVVATILVLATNYQASLDETGQIGFGDLPPGDYTLRIFANGAWQPDTKLTVPEQGELALTVTLPKREDRPEPQAKTGEPKASPQ